MRVLGVHNAYQQLGGEDTIFATEADLLESHGHHVHRYIVENTLIDQLSSAKLAADTLWNRDIYRELRSLIRREKPDVAHFHNTFPLISPAAYHAVKAEGVPVVQTLHNYRLLCPNGLFFREGQVCEDCMGQSISWPGIVHACYRDSRVASGAAAAVVKFHALLGTWSKAIDVFIAYSQFALDKFIEGGLPQEKFAFKTNFLHPAPAVGSGTGGYALFVGRLSPEKGTGTLLKAWEQLGEKMPLKIVGDGPLGPKVEQLAQKLPNVEWLGRKPLPEVYELMGEAACLIFPSEWYETFGRVAIEAFAKGTPVIAANIGAIAELVKPHTNGLHFQPGNAEDLAAQVEWVLDHPQQWQQMRRQSRTEFETLYTAPDNYRRLMEIYARAGAKNVPSATPA